MIVIIDTCVVLDAAMKRDVFFEHAKTILEAAAEDRFQGVVTVKSLMDIHYVIKHLLNDENKTRDVLKNVASLFRIIDSTAQDALRALDSDIRDYEDALMAETALSNQIDCIVTRNIKDYRKSVVPAVSPEEFLKLLAKEDQF